MPTLHHQINPIKEAEREDGHQKNVNSLRNVRIGLFSAQDWGRGLEEDIEDDLDEDLFAG
jgi:hypothetical protein